GLRSQQGPGLGHREGQRQRRRDCARSPDRCVRCARVGDAALRDAEAQFEEGIGHALHRRRPGYRHVRGALASQPEHGRGAIMDQAPQAQTLENPHKRPIAITIICIIGFIGAAVTVPLIFSETTRGIASWYPALLAVSAVIGLACTVGLWMMRKWAVYAYTAFAAVNQVILLTTGLWNPIALIIPAIVIVVMFIYLSTMR